MGAFSVSSDHELIGYSVDFAGNEHYSIRIYDLNAQNYLIDQIDRTIGSTFWHEQLPGFFYAPTNENWRCDKIMFHNLGDDPKNDGIILNEPDPLYNVGVVKSSSKKYIFVSVDGHETNEIYIINMDDYDFFSNLLRPKEEKIYHDIEYNDDYFYIKTNLNAKNYRIAKVLVMIIITLLRKIIF